MIMDNQYLLAQQYNALLEKQEFIEADLDYDIFTQQIPFLDQMAKVKNSGITVFDLFKKEHIYSSYNLEEIFGYSTSEIKDNGNEYFNSRIHPEDFIQLLRNGALLLNFFFGLPASEHRNYKLQNEYRILNQKKQYVRIIEQHLLLEHDIHQNIWLSLSVMDLSPNQTPLSSVNSQLLNIKTGEINNSWQKHNDSIQLTKRETEILQLVREGYLSKEISDNLSISIHTVNTHRQKILKKLGVNNSIEAIEYANKLNLA